MRPKVDYRTASKAAYEDFKKQHPGAQLTRQQHNAVIHCFNGALVEHILETGERIKLPFGLGELSITKYKPRRHKTFIGKEGRQHTIINLPVDWKKSRLTGRLVYHLNAHTDGYRYRWKWFRKTAFFESARCFSFRPNRVPSRKLARYLKNDPKYAQTYRQWDDS